MNQLDSIKQFTTVVADSGDIESIRHYHPEDATTNPSLLLKAAGLASYSGLIDDAIAWAKKQGGGREAQVAHACDKLAVNFGAEILKSIPGRVSTEVDARLSFNREKSIEKARHLVALYQEMGIDKSRHPDQAGIHLGGDPRRGGAGAKRGFTANLTLLVFPSPRPGPAPRPGFISSPRSLGVFMTGIRRANRWSLTWWRKIRG